MMLKSFNGPMVPMVFVAIWLALFVLVMMTNGSGPHTPNPFFVCVENTVWHMQKPVSMEDMKKVSDMCLTVVEKTSQWVTPAEGSK
jgi:hypothetical protein